MTHAATTLTCSGGEEFIARGYTVVESCKRQGRDVLAYLRQAMQAHFTGGLAPSLVPSG